MGLILGLKIIVKLLLSVIFSSVNNQKYLIGYQVTNERIKSNNPPTKRDELFVSL